MMAATPTTRRSRMGDNNDPTRHRATAAMSRRRSIIMTSPPRKWIKSSSSSSSSRTFVVVVLGAWCCWAATTTTTSAAAAFQFLPTSNSAGQRRSRSHCRALLPTPRLSMNTPMDVRDPGSDDDSQSSSRNIRHSLGARGTSIHRDETIPAAASLRTTATTFLLSVLILLGSTHPSLAATSSYDGSSSPAVESAIAALRQAKGSASDTFKAYESIGDIITEGKGVGGTINYKGVQLERGYVADEDTTIYNPGLTLLTENEKTQLVQAIIESRANSLKDSTWNDDNQLAYDFLKDKLDPLHMSELSGYLSVFPIVVGVVYVVTLAVQQLARDLFPVAYVVGAVLILAPMLALVALGPS